MIKVNSLIQLDPDDIQITAIRASGPGGQHVNKVSSAIHLRFNIEESSLPDHVKKRVLERGGRRISRDGIIHIKAQNHRSQQMNRDDAIKRLVQTIRELTHVAKVRRPTKPTRGSNERRLQSKSRRSRIKSTRGSVRDW